MANKKMSAWTALGGIACVDGTTAETITDSTMRKLTKWTANMPVNRCVADYSGDADVEVPDDGLYTVDVSMSYTGTGNRTYEVAVFVNAVEADFQMERKLGTGGDVGAGPINGILSLSAGDLVSVHHRSTDGGTAFTMHYAQLRVVKAVDL